MAKDEDRDPKPPSNVRDATYLLNSLFRTAKIDVNIVELVIAKEEIVIAYHQVEDYEKELGTIEERDDIEWGARYLAAATIATHSRQAQVYVRFYLTTTGKLKIEECEDESVSIVSPSEAGKTHVWKPTVEDAKRWAPTVVNIILSILNRLA